ncbi:hypothetical protein MRX96_003138 [Rhipicephalus microplus]|uniref:Uncharacterized protein n=1 Tax=Rhipicephalus microplus TaxID=6941 RepID=A0A9J6EFN1_RHIMP|nr:hypothetical protein HPB51_007297 [Rhipicephalus microplus]
MSSCRNYNNCPGETPRQYVWSIQQLCTCTNTSITESEKVCCLTQGLKPELMEMVPTSNPNKMADFMQHLQQLTHLGQWHNTPWQLCGVTLLKLRGSVLIRAQYQY